MNKLLELIAKYGGASGLIAAFCVYIVCTNGISKARENNEQDFKLLEYRVLTLEAQQKETNAQFNEIQKTLLSINVAISRIETLIEKAPKN